MVRVSGVGGVPAAAFRLVVGYSLTGNDELAAWAIIRGHAEVACARAPDFLAMKVFLSHSTKDVAFAVKLAERLRPERFEPWLCDTSIPPATKLGGRD